MLFGENRFTKLFVGLAKLYKIQVGTIQRIFPKIAQLENLLHAIIIVD